MVNKKPIHAIARDLGIESSKVVKACNHIGIEAKGASKRLDIYEEEKIVSHFTSGKNVANEIVDIKNNSIKTINKRKLIPKSVKSSDVLFFPNRLIKEI